MLDYYATIHIDDVFFLSITSMKSTKKVKSHILLLHFQSSLGFIYKSTHFLSIVTLFGKSDDFFTVKDAALHLTVYFTLESDS